MMEHVQRYLAEGGVLSGVPAMHDPVSRFFVQAVIVMVTCRGLSIFSFFMKQPRVIFEIVGGIILGPSAIGRDKQYLENIFPETTGLSLVANIGLVLYLFLVGLELDPMLLMTHAKRAGGIAMIGMAVPFALGVGISRVIFDVLQGSDPEYKDVSFTSFYVFVGTAMSITAFPVLARLLKEGGLIYTRAGALAMGAAALNDAVAWCLLILAISIANAKDMNTAGYVFLCVCAFALGLFFLIRPVLEWIVAWVEKQHNAVLNGHLFAFTLCMVFLCAWTTGLLGVHFIFGAFLFGLIVPRGSHLFKECNERIEELVVTFTLPLYFALSGLKTDVTTISTGEEGGITVLVCFIASIGKFIGCGGTALVSGMSFRESSVVAVLMNTRGLVELIVLNLGLEAGILSVRTFSVMVIMCLFTTFLTSPVIEFIYPPSMRENAEDLEAVEAHKKYDTAKSHDDDEITAPVTLYSKSKETRIGVVVDSMAQMQGIINTLAYFVPRAVGSELAVTAMHFIEPTNTTKDEFLGLNDVGKLIRIDEETTDLAQALRDLEDPSAKKPELLPLSMFCKAMRSAVNAFRIQGNPHEFHLEMKSLTKHNDCSLVMIPWRPHSLYYQKLLWSSIHVMHVPIVLVMQKEAATFGSDNGDERKRLGSDELRVRGRSDSGGSNLPPASSISAPPSSHTAAGGGRARGNSFFATKSFRLDGSTAENEEGISEHMSSQVLFSSYTGTIPMNRRGTLTNTMTKLPKYTITASEIVAVMTGRAMDLAVLQMLLRFAECSTNSIHVLLPKDRTEFDPENRSALKQFKKETVECKNVHFEQLETISTDIEGLYNDIIAIPFDLLIASFIEPKEHDGDHDNRHHTDSDRHHHDIEAGITRTGSTGRQQRSHTLTGALADAIVGAGNETADSEELRRLAGVPERFIHSALHHVELGQLGSMVYERAHTKSSTVMILHESHKLFTTRRSSVNSSASLDNLADIGKTEGPGGTIASPPTAEVVEVHTIEPFDGVELERL